MFFLQHLLELLNAKFESCKILLNVNFFVLNLQVMEAENKTICLSLF